MLSAIDEIDAIQTTLLRALASPHRLRIIHLLGQQSRDVTELGLELGLNQATVSQHLASMRSVGLVEAVRDGRRVHYRLSDPEIVAACNLMRGVIVRHLTVLGRLAAAVGQGAGDPRADAREGRTTRGQVTHP